MCECCVITPAFQSTPPARGATATRYCIPTRTLISIHAPREGGDLMVSRISASIFRFQSTPPARGATEKAAEAFCRSWISIHAPREGGDSKDAQFYLRIFDK